MTAETDLLPLPRTLRHPSDADLAEHVQAYARACVSSATEALRADVERWKSLHATAYDAFRIGVATERRLEARAERLAEALRVAEAALADIGDADREPGDDVAWCERRAARALPTVRAALDQETTNG